MGQIWWACQDRDKLPSSSIKLNLRAKDRNWRNWISRSTKRTWYLQISYLIRWSGSINQLCLTLMNSVHLMLSHHKLREIQWVKSALNQYHQTICPPRSTKTFSWTSKMKSNLIFPFPRPSPRPNMHHNSIKWALITHCLQWKTLCRWQREF
jgi:hypothetical protein